MWLSVKEVAILLGYVERTIRAKAKNGEYEYHYISSSSGRGGRKMEILLESLPEQAQIAYQNKSGIADFQPVVNTDYPSATPQQRKKGDLKSKAIVAYKKFQKQALKNGMKSKVAILDAFIEKWNIEYPDFPINRDKMYDWRRKSKSGNPERLIDKRGGYNRGNSSIPTEYQEHFKKLYLNQTKPTITSCFTETKIFANMNGDIIPGIKAFRLLVKNLDKALVTRFREGKKAFTDTCEPYTERDYSLMNANDWWVSDHHLWDIFVRYQNNKGEWKIGRPWGSYWMDMRTRKVMSSIIRIEEPNSDIVLCSFGLGVEHFGVPKGVRLDNGKDYKANDLFSQDDTNHIADSLAINLDINVTYAIPYNARAKPIERLFNTFEEQLGKKYPSYAGSNAKKRPEDLKDLDIMDYVTLEEFIEHHNMYVYEIYNNTPHQGDSMFNKTPNQMYSSLDFTLRKVPKDILYFCLMRVKGTRTVQRNGITFNGVHFYNDNCINHIGKKVIAKYDPAKPEILYIFDENENYLFLATKVKKMGWNLDAEDFHKENERKKIARQKALNSYTADNTIRSTSSIGERLDLLAKSTEKSSIADPTIVEIIRNEKAEETVRRINLSDVEKNYEDVLKRQQDERNKSNDRQKQLADRFKSNMLDKARESMA